MKYHLYLLYAKPHVEQFIQRLECHLVALDGISLVEATTTFHKQHGLIALLWDGKVNLDDLHFLKGDLDALDLAVVPLIEDEDESEHAMSLLYGPYHHHDEEEDCYA